MKRNSNIELLRILSMIMVLVLHALKNSGALSYLSGVHFWIYWSMEALCIVAVNCFICISSYFTISSNRFKSINLLRVCGVVWSYTLIFCLMEHCISGDKFTRNDLLMMFFPVLTKKFWFVNSYLLFYLLTPFLNKLVRSLHKKSLEYLVCILILVFSVRMSIFPLTWSQDGFGGYSISLFVVLYFIAAWIKLYYHPSNNKPLKSLAMYFASTLFLLFSKYGLMRFFSESYSNKLYNNISIIVIIQSTSLFLFFLFAKPVQQKIERIVLFVSKHCFSVYIIHYCLIGVLFTKMIHLDSKVQSATTGVPALVFSCLIIFICCIVIDIIRERLILFCGKLIHPSIKNRFRLVIGKIDEIGNSVYDSYWQDSEGK